MMNYSPLRYPGGKARLSPFIKLLIEKTAIQNPVYIEPYAGGAGVALSLLIDDVVDEIVINDYDKAIYSMWRAILEDTEDFIRLIENTPVNVDEWHNQKAIYLERNKKYSVELGFSAFFLNRTNRSGIISNAGPIGGFDQTGNYAIGVRYNSTDLVERVREIAKHKDKIHLYNKDAKSLIANYLPKYEGRAFVYFDPPYYNKGKVLYKNFYTATDHKDIFTLIRELKCPWVVTYDDVPEIRKLYSEYSAKLYDLTYSLANSGTKSELMFVSDNALWPTAQEMSRNHITINLREI